MPTSQRKESRLRSEVTCPRDQPWSVLLRSHLGSVGLPLPHQGGPTSLRTQSRWGIGHSPGSEQARERSEAPRGSEVGPRLLAAQQGRLTLASSVRPSFTTG